MDGTESEVLKTTTEPFFLSTTMKPSSITQNDLPEVSAGCNCDFKITDGICEHEIYNDDEEEANTNLYALDDELALLSEEFDSNRKDYKSQSSSPQTSEGKMVDSCTLSAVYQGEWPLEKLYWNDSMDRTSMEGDFQLDTASIMSFDSSMTTSSMAALHNQVSSEQSNAKADVVCTLLSMLHTHDKMEVSEMLITMSSKRENCIAMIESGCLPLLVQLLHDRHEKPTFAEFQQKIELRKRASQILHNIVFSQPDDKKGRREARVLKLLEQVRSHCDSLRLSSYEDDEKDKGRRSDEELGPTVAALMKLSFDEDHRHAMCLLGGLQAITELIEIDQEVHGCTNDQYCTMIRRYSCMALTNLTFGDGTNKSLLCSMKPFMEALVAQLYSPNEDLKQVSASVLRNLSWRADLESKEMLREVGAVTILMKAAMETTMESTLKSILSALWNLSAHCSENKADICAIDGALGFLVKMLTFKSGSKNMSVVESGGGILRNISSHIAIQNDHRITLRKHNCLQILLRHLKSPSLTVVSNACGTLWNLSARNAQDQRALWEMGAVGMLKKLIHSKHKMISMGSSAALKNLLSAAPPGLESGFGVSVNDYNTDMPSLQARKQKILNAEIDQNLTETYDNTDSPKNSPTLRKKSVSNVTVNRRSHSAPVHRPGIPQRVGSKSPHTIADSHNSESSIELSNIQRYASPPRSARNSQVQVEPVVPIAKVNSLNGPLGRARSPQVVNGRVLGSNHEPTVRVGSPGNARPLSYPSQKGKLRSCSVPQSGHGNSIGSFQDSCNKSQKILPMTDNNYTKFSQKMKNIKYDEPDCHEHPVDYSLRYSEESSQFSKSSTESKIPLPKMNNYVGDGCRPSAIVAPMYIKDVGQKQRIMPKLKAKAMVNSSFDSDLDEDMDQVVDYSQKYQDRDSVVERRLREKQKKRTSIPNVTQPPKLSNDFEDSVKVYCTEDTPVNFSSASSLTDLCDIDSLSSHQYQQQQQKQRYHKDISPPYPHENETFYKPNAEEKSPEKDKMKKSLKPGEEMSCVETPLMFSRSSSLGSLSSFDQPSIPDDRSSIVSDFSRLASGVISPSEIPDSPSQTVPSSPRTKRQTIFDKKANETIDNNQSQASPNLNKFSEPAKHSPPVRPSTQAWNNTKAPPSQPSECYNYAEDTLKVYNIEGTPDLSHAASYSDLSMLSFCAEKNTCNPSAEVSYGGSECSFDGESNIHVTPQKINNMDRYNESIAMPSLNNSQDHSDNSSMYEDGDVQQLEISDSKYKIQLKIQTVVEASVTATGSNKQADKPVNFHSMSSAQVRKDEKSISLKELNLDEARVVNSMVVENSPFQHVNLCLNNKQTVLQSKKEYDEEILLQQCVLAGMPKSKNHSISATSQCSKVNQSKYTLPVAHNNVDVRKELFKCNDKHQGKSESVTCQDDLTVQEEALLQQCILQGMPKPKNNRISNSLVADTGTTTSLANGLTDKPVNFQSMSGIQVRKDEKSIQHKDSNLDEDVVNSMLVEGTPVSFSRNSSLSSLTMESGDEMPQECNSKTTESKEQYYAVQDLLKFRQNIHHEAVVMQAAQQSSPKSEKKVVNNSKICAQSNLEPNAYTSTQHLNNTGDTHDKMSLYEKAMVQECMNLGTPKQARGNETNVTRAAHSNGSGLKKQPSENYVGLLNIDKKELDSDEALLQQCILAGMPKPKTYATSSSNYANVNTNHQTKYSSSPVRKSVYVDDGSSGSSDSYHGRNKNIVQEGDLTDEEEALLQQCILQGMPKRKNSGTIPNPLGKHDPKSSQNSQSFQNVMEADKIQSKTLFNQHIVASQKCEGNKTELSDDELLQQCILAGMPKPKTVVALKAIEGTVNTSPIQIPKQANESTSFHDKTGDTVLVNVTRLTKQPENFNEENPPNELTALEEELLQKCISAGMPKPKNVAASKQTFEKSSSSVFDAKRCSMSIESVNKETTTTKECNISERSAPVGMELSEKSLNKAFKAINSIGNTETSEAPKGEVNDDANQDISSQNSSGTDNTVVFNFPADLSVESQKLADDMLEAIADGTEDMTVSTMSCMSDIENIAPPSVMGELACLSLTNSCCSDDFKAIKPNKTSHKKTLLRELQMSRLGSDTDLSQLGCKLSDSSLSLNTCSNSTDIIDNIHPPSALDDISLTASIGSLNNLPSEILDSNSSSKCKRNIADDNSMNERLCEAAAMVEMYTKEFSSITGIRNSNFDTNNTEQQYASNVESEVYEDVTEPACDTIASDIEFVDELPCDEDDMGSETLLAPQLSSLNKEDTGEGSTENLTFTLTEEPPVQNQPDCRDEPDYELPDDFDELRENADLILNSLKRVHVSESSSDFGGLASNDMLEDETLSLVSNGSDDDSLSPDGVFADGQISSKIHSVKSHRKSPESQKLQTEASTESPPAGKPSHKRFGFMNFQSSKNNLSPTMNSSHESLTSDVPNRKMSTETVINTNTFTRRKSSAKGSIPNVGDMQAKPYFGKALKSPTFSSRESIESCSTSNSVSSLSSCGDASVGKTSDKKKSISSRIGSIWKGGSKSKSKSTIDPSKNVKPFHDHAGTVLSDRERSPSPAFQRPYSQSSSPKTLSRSSTDERINIHQENISLRRPTTLLLSKRNGSPKSNIQRSGTSPCLLDKHNTVTSPVSQGQTGKSGLPVRKSMIPTSSKAGTGDQKGSSDSGKQKACMVTMV